jgi:NitT/TauT family transport system permease protein
MSDVLADGLVRGDIVAGRASRSVPWLGLIAVATWFVTALVTYILPDTGDFDQTSVFAALLAGAGGLILGAATVGVWRPKVTGHLRAVAPWLVALSLACLAWELMTAKLALLPMPFFPPPQAVFGVFIDDWARILDCVWHSLFLLLVGYAFGSGVGFVLGIATGWSKVVGYWTHPVLRFLGPLPATAWLPLAFFIFPSSWSASTFLIALASGFPVTVLTWSGVASVDKSFYDVARTLGASQRFLIFRVAIPAALPHVFVGLFMGLSGAFAVLVVAEMLGVKSGLGWYLQWAQGWAAYANMYAALLVMAIICSSLISVLFRVRNRLLVWQKGLVQW